jgi:Tol biopolymer transport system component
MHPAEEGWGAWDPSGRRFYFTSNRNGAFNVWVQEEPGGQARQVTHFDGQSRGLPEEALYTKFAVSGSRLIVPIEGRRASVWLEPPEGG